MAILLPYVPDYGKGFYETREQVESSEIFIDIIYTIPFSSRILITVYVTVGRNKKLGARSSRVAVDAASMSMPRQYNTKT